MAIKVNVVYCTTSQIVNVPVLVAHWKPIWVHDQLIDTLIGRIPDWQADWLSLTDLLIDGRMDGCIHAWMYRCIDGHAALLADKWLTCWLFD